MLFLSDSAVSVYDGARARAEFMVMCLMQPCPILRGDQESRPGCAMGDRRLNRAQLHLWARVHPCATLLPSGKLPNPNVNAP